jgi:hypothetical protein
MKTAFWVAFHLCMTIATQGLWLVVLIIYKCIK